MVTLKDIARATGVSKTTVSYILGGQHNKGHFSGETYRKVKAAAESMGYSYDDIARAMSTGKANVIGFTAPDSPFEFVYETLSGAIQRAAELGYFIKVIKADWRSPSTEIISVCRKQKLSGVICYNLRREVTNEIKAALDTDGLPAVVTGNNPSPSNVIKIMSNDYMGGALSAAHLHKLGHSKIALISPRIPDSPFREDRLRGFADKMAELNLDFPQKYFLEAKNNREITGFTMRALKDKKNGPTAIFCMSDFFALRAITAAQNAGFHVPRDISVTGYANMLFCEYSVPSITSVAQPHSGIGAKAVEKVVEALRAGRLDAEKPEILDVRLIARKSSGPAPERSRLL
jgi:LacI family transcriptional regulator